MEKKVFLNVTKLKANQQVELPGGKTFVAKQDETSIYIPENIELKKGDKLYLNPIPEEKRKFNQTHYVTIKRGK